MPMKAVFISIRKRRQVLLWVLFTCALKAYAQPQIYFNSQGSTNVSLRFSSINYRIEYQLDSVSTYSSPQFRRKFVSAWTDTVMGLSLNTEYFFRSRFVDGTGSPVSSWSGTVYKTATYPLPDLFKQTTATATLSTPVYKYTHYTETFFELWYDTVPGFNSSQLKKFSGSTLYAIYKLGLIQNHKSYYLRARVADGTESLPWKTIHVVNRFRPSVKLQPNGGCTDTSIAYYLSFSNYISDAVSFSNKTYVRRGNKVDSFTGNSIGVNLQIQDSNSIQVFCNTSIQYDSATVSYKDTQIFRNILGSIGQISYDFTSDPKNVIYFNGSSCNTFIELELYEDSTLSNRLNTRTNTNGKTNGIIGFVSNWDYFKQNVLRYRSIRFGYVSEWSYIYPKDFTPRIAHTSFPGGADTTSSKWTVYRYYTFPGKQLEVWLDVDPSFNSPKRKQYFINDSSEFYLESLFGNYNYVKCRLTDGTQFSKWSNTASKPFTSAPLNRLNFSMTHPMGYFSIFPYANVYGVQLQLGKDAQNLNYNLDRAENNIPDTFDFVRNEQVYFRARRYTPIDTSVWGKVQSFVYYTNQNICMSPKITYNGNRFGKDTFDIRWIERDPAASTGYHLYLAKSPAAFSIEGIIELPAGSTSANIRRRDFPNSWYFALYPNCKFNKSYSPLGAVWYPLDPLVSVQSAGAYNDATQVFYNSSRNALECAADFAFDCSVYDLNGRLLTEQALDAATPLYLPALNSGIYYAKLCNGSTCYTLKYFVP